MNYSRRQFLRDSGLLGAGLALTGLEGCAGKSQKGVHPFGIQLYTLRDVIPQDPKGVLAKLANWGYTQIESYGGQQGIFWGMKNTEFKKYLDGIGLTMISSHCGDTNFEALAAEAGEIGMKYLICPYLGAQKTLDDYKRHADRFNKFGEICRKNGLRYAYHNHGYSFKLTEGLYPQDVMMEACDPNLVDFELDLYWVVDAGQDPEAWIKKYKNRIRLCHIKDRLKTPDPKQDNNSCTLGEGSIDFASILKTGNQNGLNYWMVEQERYAGTTPIKCAEDNAAYMKALKV